MLRKRFRNVVLPQSTQIADEQLQQWKQLNHKAAEGVALYQWWANNPGHSKVADACSNTGMSTVAYYEAIDWLIDYKFISAKIAGPDRQISMLTPAVIEPKECSDYRVVGRYIGMTIVKCKGINGKQCPDTLSTKEINILEAQLASKGMDVSTIGKAIRFYSMLRDIPSGESIYRTELPHSHATTRKFISAFSRVHALHEFKASDNFIAMFPIINNMERYTMQDQTVFLRTAQSEVTEYALANQTPQSQAKRLRDMVYAIQAVRKTSASSAAVKDLIVMSKLIKQVPFYDLRAQLIVFFTDPDSFEECMGWRPNDKVIGIQSFASNHQAIADEVRAISVGYGPNATSWWKKPMSRLGLDHWIAD